MGLEQISGEIRAIEYVGGHGYEQYRILTIERKAGNPQRIAVLYDGTKDHLRYPEIPLEPGTQIRGLIYHPVSIESAQEDILPMALRMKSLAPRMPVDGIAQHL